MKLITILLLITINCWSVNGQYGGYGEYGKFTKEDRLFYRFQETCLEGVCYEEMDDPEFRVFVIEKLSSERPLYRHRALNLLGALRDSFSLSSMTPFLYVERESIVRIAMGNIARVNSCDSPIYLLEALDSLHLYNDGQTYYTLLNKLFYYPHKQSVQPLLKFSCPDHVEWDQEWIDRVNILAHKYGEFLEAYFKSKDSRTLLLKDQVLHNRKYKHWAFKQIYRQADKQYWINFLRQINPKDRRENIYLLRARYILGDKEYSEANQKYIESIKKSNLIRHNYE